MIFSPRVYTTPTTKLTWSTLAQWCDCALTLNARPCSRQNNERMEFHVNVLPLALINTCTDEKALRACRSLLQHGPKHIAQPSRGQRANAPHTALIVAINNRLSALKA